MYYPIEGGSVEVIQSYECNLPPVGYGKNRLTGELEYVGVIKRSLRQEKQMWQRIDLPPDWDKKRKAEERTQLHDPEYYDTDLEKIREQHWRYRLCGMWFMNNGKETYITGSYYMYLNWNKIDIGYPYYRDTDRRFYYVWEYCVEDPRCAGLVDVERRRMGKTFKSGSILLDRASLNKNHHGGIQSKTSTDAKQVFLKTVVNFFKKLPDFFRPVYDKSKGLTPSSELRFFQTSKKGRNAEDILDGDELESWIDYGSSEPFHYDGSKLNSYVMDEFGKCLAKGTQVLMYDGSVKKVEDINNGELVMGNDSLPRLVSGVATGTEAMYEVVPKSGCSFGCNESHILSLKWANRSWHYNNWQFDETVNISVKDYLGLSDQVRKHLMLWRVGVDYAEKRHLLEPYFLGAWLGDGFSGYAGFSSNSPEVVDYMHHYATANGLSIRKIPQSNYDYHISCNALNGYNAILKSLQHYDLVKNKHIPSEYLIDSEKNRLELLAGLLDTDGYLIKRNGKPAGYEITQKRKPLALQIQALAAGLGFKATLREKTATMVRKDGTVFKCVVFRVCVFGDLYRIPCRVTYKKAAKVAYHQNRRNPLRTGFCVKAVGPGKYYGFAVDKNHLFLLADYTVIHNTMECNVWDRWNVVRFCLDQDGYWVGKALLTTTIEEMENGGENGKRIWDSSDPNERNENGRTKSGLYRFFLPAFDTTFFDQYGMPEVERAKAHYLNERAGLQSDPRALSSMIRKNPFDIHEAFRIDGDRCLYDSMKLNIQLDSLSYKVNLTTRGNFVWENGEEFTKVKFEKSANGRWEVCWLFDRAEEANKIVQRNGRYYPNNNFAFTIGCDPFKYDAVKDSRRSDCAAFVFKKNDLLSPNNPYNEAFICYYRYRAVTTALQYEDLLKMAWYYGCQILFERNVDNWRDFYRTKACEGFLMKLPGENDYGIYTDGQKQVHQMIADYTEAYINENIERVYFKRLVEEWLLFDIGMTTKWDTAMAAGFTLIAARDKSYSRAVESSNDIKNYFKRYKVPA